MHSESNNLTIRSAAKRNETLAYASVTLRLFADIALAQMLVWCAVMVCRTCS